jgi:hypothetical protein
MGGLELNDMHGDSAGSELNADWLEVRGVLTKTPLTRLAQMLQFRS